MADTFRAGSRMLLATRPVLISDEESPMFQFPEFIHRYFREDRLRSACRGTRSASILVAGSYRADVPPTVAGEPIA